MNFRSMLLVTGMAYASAAGAITFPVYNPAGGEDCPKRVEESNAEDFRSLIHKVSVGIDGKDDRGALAVKAPEHGIPDGEVKHLRAGNGFIYCPGTRYGNPVSLHATVVEKDDQITTNVHALIDEHGRYREPFSSCYFQNYGTPVQKRYLDLANGLAGGRYRIGTNSPFEHDDLDRAVIKFKPCSSTQKKNCGPIAGAAFKIDMAEPRIAQNQRVFMVSAIQKRMREPVRNDLILQQCTSRKTYDARGPRGSVILTDCSATQGSSASSFYSFDEGTKKLSLRAIAVGGSTEFWDGKEFSIADGNFTKGLVIDSKFLDDVVAVGENQGKQMAQEYKGLIIPASATSGL